MTKRLGFDKQAPTEFPKKEEYDREIPPHVPRIEQKPEDLRIRRMRPGW
eukprot:CAMPEP_0174821510 /NCGR_PEP_ID=MMETSP1107-20130205/9017_1 /TAXON_ID=36770 /ORGANISM="Paraphysomonas vestita, Strain GFlagA" /LENGTH=48 /DNA_ID= /DNA_START= /DNA_END= /DNA_ORIENTATION=